MGTCVSSIIQACEIVVPLALTLPGDTQSEIRLGLQDLVEVIGRLPPLKRVTLELVVMLHRTL